MVECIGHHDPTPIDDEQPCICLPYKGVQIDALPFTNHLASWNIYILELSLSKLRDVLDKRILSFQEATISDTSKTAMDFSSSDQPTLASSKRVAEAFSLENMDTGASDRVKVICLMQEKLKELEAKVSSLESKHPKPGKDITPWYTSYATIVSLRLRLAS